MICPICAAQCGENHLFCHQCGSRLPESVDAAPAADIPEEVLVPEADPVPAEQEPQAPPAPETPTVIQEYVPEPTAPAPEPTPTPKKGKLWPPLVILAAMICVGTLLFFLIPGTAADPSDPTLSTSPASVWFTVENGVLSFNAEEYDGPAELEIPSTVDGQTVTAIADYAFSGEDGITTVILPESVTKIGDYAFSSCKGLRGIYIPSTVTSIGVYAFADCDALEAIYLPGTLETMGHGSLDSCDGLHYILFDGTYAQWNRLYSGYFISNVELHTIDGTYYAHP